MNKIYFQAFRNGEFVASGFCDRYEKYDREVCEYRFWNGDAYIAIAGVGLELKEIAW